MRVNNQRCEFLRDPLGVDGPWPRLSWQLDDPRRGARQQAYQVQAAATAEGLVQGQAGLWDSGRIESAQNHLVPYAGAALRSGQWVYWRVRVWDQDDQASAWSEPAHWSMGRLTPEAWAPAVWIGLDRPDPTSPTDEFRHLPARYLRREFAVAAPVRRAVVTLCGLGCCDLHLNGARVAGDQVMNPAQTDFDKTVLYQTFDVTAAIRPGPNAIGVVLGNGRFHALRPGGHRDFGFPKLVLRLEVDYADGRHDVVVSDGDWRVTDQGPIRANHEYDGEHYDARQEMPGWDASGFDDRAWEPVQLVAAPGGRLEASMLEPTRIVEALSPAALHRHVTGPWLVDFGHATYGQPRIHVRGAAGTQIRIVGAYSLRPDGTLKTEDNRGARCTDIYICKGTGEEVWSPRFRGQGCRWLEINGWPGELKPEAIQLLVVRHGAESAGTFSCSDPLLTRISENVGRGVRAFLRQGLPMEPDRDERQPWLGDPACGARSYAVHLQVAPFLRKWLADIRLAQREDGSIPAIAPKYWTFGAQPDAVWPAVITILPDWLYRHYGDRRAIEENYPAACRWVEHLERGLRADGTTDAGVYGDWCDAASMDGQGSDHGATSRPLIASAYLIHSAQRLARMAENLDRPTEVAAWRARADRWTEAFNRRFFDPVTAMYEAGTQCALLLPLAFDLVPAAHRERVLGNLVRDILETHHGHTTVGLIGHQWLLPTLSRLGRADVAHTIATRTARPSWGYMVGKGATTIWERWDTDTRGPGMNSEALLIQAGSLGAWFVETLAGIAPDSAGPGFVRLRLCPHPVPGLEWARAEIQTPHGPARSHWRQEQGRWVWEVTVPPNTAALARIPCDPPDDLREGGVLVADAPGVSGAHFQDGAVVLELGAGNYAFSLPSGQRHRESSLFAGKCLSSCDDRLLVAGGGMRKSHLMSTEPA